VMAADGQVTAGNIKIPALTKLLPVRFDNGWALIGEAGDNALSGRALQEIEAIARCTAIVDSRSVPRATQAAMQVVRNELRAKYFGCDVEKLNDLIKKQGDCRWLIGYFFGRRPVLYKISMSEGPDSPVRSFYAAIGSGRSLAEYLLSYVVRPDMNIMEAEMAAIYVVEEVKRHDLYCSGQTHVAFVGPGIALMGDPKRALKLVRDSVRTKILVKNALLTVFSARFREAITEFGEAFAVFNAYTTKHPEARKLPISQVAKRIDAGQRQGRGRRALAKIRAIPPYMVRLLASKTVNTHE
jgi:hypothetical protein